MALRELQRQRALFRLVTEVCCLAHDPPAWTKQLMTGLQEFFAAKVIGLAWANMPDVPTDFNRVEIQVHQGFSPRELRSWIDYYYGPQQTFRSEFLRRVLAIRSHFVTVRRQDVMGDAEWYALPEVSEILRPCDVDANLTSFFVASSAKRLFGIGVHRPFGAPQFTRQERNELRRIHVELARAWRFRMQLPNHPTPPIADRLPGRLQQILWLLCLGRNEKEIASELKLSPHTVHNHIRRLYESFAVHTRQELLVKAFSQEGVSLRAAFPSVDMNMFKPE